MSVVRFLTAGSIVIAGCSTQVQGLDMETSFAPDVEAPPEHPAEHDPPADPGNPDPGTEPDPVEDPPPPTGTDACYPGAADDWTTCMGVVAPANLPSDYDYPPPLNGSAQYREPAAYLDLDAIDPSLALAPNFLLSEIAQAYKGRYAVVQPHAVDQLQGVRDALGPLTINSGYRNPDYNAGVGGVSTSRHMYGDAFDIDPWSVSLDRLADECHARGAGYVGVYATHIHCDWRDDPVDEVFYGGAWRSAAVPAPRPFLDAWVERDGSRLLAPAVGWDEGEPLREWVALDGAGRPMAWHTGEDWVPPAGAVEVEVWVGREIVRTFPL